MAYVSTPLGRWFYEEHGASRRESDAAIVLLHGLLFDGSVWGAQVGPLSAIGRVLVFDGPGHGRSRETPPHFSLEDHADALAEALSSLAAPRAIIVGHSWGGMAALRFALKHRDRLRALALLGASADREDRSTERKYRLLETVGRRLGFPGWLVNRGIAPLLFGKATLRDRPEVVRGFARRLRGFSRNGLARAGQAVLIERSRVLDELAAITSPTLVLCGAEDRAMKLAEGIAIADRIAASALVTIEGAGHTPTLEQPDAVNAALLPFIRQHLEGENASSRVVPEVEGPGFARACASSVR